MKIIFSNHADKQLLERNLSRDLIIRALKRPDKLILQSGKRYRALKTIRRQNEKLLLVIVYDVVNSAHEVVTAFLTSKFKKYL